MCEPAPGSLRCVAQPMQYSYCCLCSELTPLSRLNEINLPKVCILGNRYREWFRGDQHILLLQKRSVCFQEQSKSTMLPSTKLRYFVSALFYTRRGKEFLRAPSNECPSSGSEHCWRFLGSRNENSRNGQKWEKN